MIKQKHQQLFDILVLQLNSGRWKKGERLPSIRELAQEYNVSINVAAKAVDLLKNAGLVSVRVGDGVFSQVQEVAEKQDIRYSGYRIFGHYASAKHLRVLVEDTNDLQLLFWNKFFKHVTEKYRDIELEISYGTSKQKDFDIAFGALGFLLAHGFSPDNSLSAAEQEIFSPGIYRDLPLDPENCRMGEHRNYFPYGFVSNVLISQRELPPPREQESILEYVERLAAENLAKPVSYNLCSGLEFLTNAGVFFSDPDKGTFSMPDQELLKNVFERTSKLYHAGHIKWQHGEIRDSIIPADITEISQAHVGLLKEDFEVYPSPPGKSFSPTLYLAAISARTLFPEECFRLLANLLSADFQNKAEAERIFHAIRPMTKNNVITNFLDQIPPVLNNSQNSGLSHILQYFVTWEFFHYINGKCDFAPQRLEAKIRWYLDHAQAGKSTDILS